MKAIKTNTLNNPFQGRGFTLCFDKLCIISLSFLERAGVIF
jgi:hypothetical protein